jgi:lipoprotein-releasing system ATP-binding protein
MSNPIVSVRDLTRTFVDDAGAFDVLKQASFTIDQGEMVALAGVSGAGKTTLLQILGGLDKPSAGAVEIGGKRLDTLRSEELARFRRDYIGFVFQFHHLLPEFTAIENVIMPGLILRRSRAACMARGRELMGLVGLERRLNHYPSELSGGERQRAALARALFNEPALVLADEPTGNLDSDNSKQLLHLLRKANQRLGQTFLIATHNERLARSLNRTIYIQDGKIVRGDARPDSVEAL